MSFNYIEAGSKRTINVVSFKEDNDRLKQQIDTLQAKRQQQFDRWQLAQGIPSAPQGLSRSLERGPAKNSDEQIRLNVKRTIQRWRGDAMVEACQQEFTDRKSARHTEIMAVAQWLADPEGTNKKGIQPPLKFLYADGAHRDARYRVYHLLRTHADNLRQIRQSPPYTAEGHPGTHLIAAMEQQLNAIADSHPVLDRVHSFTHNKDDILVKKFGKAGRLITAVGGIGLASLYTITLRGVVNPWAMVPLGAAYLALDKNALTPALQQELNQVAFGQLPRFQELTAPLRGAQGAELMRTFASKTGATVLQKLRIQKKTAKEHPLTNEEFADLKKELAPNGALRGMSRNDLGFLISMMQSVKARPKAITDISTVVENGIRLG